MSDEETRYDGQFRNPTGEDGRTVLEGMNGHHAPIHEWCISHMPRSVDGCVLDVGCGGGMMIRRMSERFPFAMFHGVDISEEALKMTLEVNSDIVSEGGLEVHRCSVDDMPFEDGSFDLVSAVETYFFWPDLDAALAEICRVMSPGGLLSIGSEMQDEDPSFAEDALRKYGARVVTDDVMLAKMDAAGFDARVEKDRTTGITDYVGVKRF